MAYMIPEPLGNAPVIDSDVYALIRRLLPNDVYVWHASAMELAEDESIPFLLQSEEAGIAVLFPLDGRIKPEKAEQEIALHKARFEAFKTLLEGFEPPVLVDEHGRLKHAIHHVCIAMKLSGKQITASGLRNLDPGIVMLGEDELGQMVNILAAATLPVKRVNNESFDAVRACISPNLKIPFASKRDVKITPEDAGWQPLRLLDIQQEQAVKSFTDIPEAQEGMARDLDTRMIRGVAGSGKSLVLLHRAHYLARQNPDWKILVLTYNKALADFLRARHCELQNPSGNITIQNFHTWCRAELYEHGLWLDILKGNSSGLLMNILSKQNVYLSKDEAAYYIEEFEWIRDMDIRTLDAYLKVDRRGRLRKFDAGKRRQAWSYFEKYLSQLRANGVLDWPQVAVNMLAAIEEGQIPKAQYHAILIDEAQDFAPIWFKIVQTQLRPATNSLFIVADVAQKIYRRSVSWRSLGIDINSRRIRILKKSYRNTYQILKAANDVVSDTSVVNDLKGDDEEITAPDMDALTMRKGAVPVLWQVKDQHRQANVIVEEIKKLRSLNYSWGDFAILTRYNLSSNGDNPLLHSLNQANIPIQIVRGPEINMAADVVKLTTLHASKGLEFSAVFVADVDQMKLQSGIDPEEMDKQIAIYRRLLYVGMTRARERLYLLHTAPLPDWLSKSLVSVERTTTR